MNDLILPEKITKEEDLVIEMIVKDVLETIIEITIDL